MPFLSSSLQSMGAKELNLDGLPVIISPVYGGKGIYLGCPSCHQPSSLLEQRNLSWMPFLSTSLQPTGAKEFILDALPVIISPVYGGKGIKFGWSSCHHLSSVWGQRNLSWMPFLSSTLQSIGAKEFILDALPVIISPICRY